MITLEDVAGWIRGRYFSKREHVATRAGTQHANLPVKTNSSGYVDVTLLEGGYLKTIGDTGNSSANTDRYQADIGDISGTQKLEVDVTVANGARRFVTHFDVSLSRSGNVSVYCLAHATALWQTNNAGATATVHGYEIQYAMSGTPTGGGITAITNGIRLTLDSSDFTNSLDDNMVVVTSVGHHAEDLVYGVTIS